MESAKENGGARGRPIPGASPSTPGPDPARADIIARQLLRAVNRAVREHDLIRPGDRIAVGVSGGKDSRTLLELLRRGVDVPGGYQVVAVHVDGSGAGLPDQRPMLGPWLRSLGIDLHFEPLPVDPDGDRPPTCFRCARARRRALFRAAEALGCNTVAVGHHADDDAITVLLSILYKGRLESLAPRRSYFDDRFLLIRPLIRLTEAEIARYARARGWTFAPESECPRRAHSRRAHMQRCLADFPRRERMQIRTNLLALGRRSRP